MSRRAANDNAQITLESLNYRLINIEALLTQLLEMMQQKRAKAYKRSRDDTHRAYQNVVASGFQPTEAELRAAELSLARAMKR